jgi:hypothetical protein
MKKLFKLQGGNDHGTEKRWGKTLHEKGVKEIKI